MDFRKQFTIFTFIFLFIGIEFAKSAPMTHTAEVTKPAKEKFTNNRLADKRTAKNEIDNIATEDDDEEKISDTRKSRSFDIPPDDLAAEESMIARQNKMLAYFNYLPPPMMAATYSSPAFYPAPELYNDLNDLDDEDMARGNRRRPNGNQNSPIFYIRLPPTPYMFVPGMGYISQPPSIQPIPMQAPVRQVPVNPFINLPLNFLSNGKPTNVYQWNAAPQLDNTFGPQFPSYLPARPQTRPTYRPKPQYLQDTKITHLKGPFVFNGRPDEIFVLPNSNPYNQQYNPNYNAPYSNNNFNSLSYNGPPSFSPAAFGTPYNAPFNSIYSDALQNYY